MSYQPLARQYRPSTFDELIGQESISLTLKNAISIGREPHAVIFAGIRGTGKTTLARVYAKALNCVNGPTPEPCCTCDSCVAITDGVHEDVFEIDGASNTGVDDIRNLRDTVGYLPQRSKFRIYIIDEVHMLSQSAFNALLKTLEEPPSHVVFVFATTELHKIPQTILSRCQTLHLQKISIADIEKHLSTILTKENVEFEPKALNIIAREGRGSMRDALTFLDKAIALCNGKLTMQALSQLTAAAGAPIYLKLLDALIKKDIKLALNEVETIDNAGIEFPSAIEELAKYARHAFIVRDIGPEALDISLLGLDEEELARLTEIAKFSAPFDLNRIFRSLVKCRVDLDGSALDKYVVENYLMEWCLDPGLVDIDTLLNDKKNISSSTPSTQPSEPVQQRTYAPAKELKSKLSSFKQQQSQTTVTPTPAVEQPPTTHIDAVTEDPKPVLSASAVEVKFPDTWAELVETWKRQKPLQARILEELLLIEYSPARISVAVNENSLAGSKLLQKDVQSKMLAGFTDLFGFKGAFNVTKRDDKTTVPSQESLENTEESGNVNKEAQNPLPIQETLLEQKERQKKLLREKIKGEALNNSLTLEASKVFEANVDDVEVKV